MSITIADAARAYGRIANIGGASGLTGDKASPGAGGTETSFGDMVGTMVTGTANALGKAETASLRQVAGKGDLIDVVTAMGAAETALDTMVAVRDKVVSAYGEIMRMQI